MFKKILVAVDGSENAVKALETAVGLQKMTDATLCTITVFRHQIRLGGSLTMVRRPDQQNLDEAMRDHAKDVADCAKKAALEMGAKAPRAFVKSGLPSRTIVQFAKDHGIDLIVLGTRGQSDVDGYFLGSVSHRVTSLAECPVLVV